ncbi:hypothetical protein U1Q18_017840 [Sarracenia purpurea var. burkii]
MADLEKRIHHLKRSSLVKLEMEASSLIGDEVHKSSSGPNLIHISGNKGSKVAVELPIVFDHLPQRRQDRLTVVDVTGKETKSAEGIKPESGGDDAESDGEKHNLDEDEEKGEHESRDSEVEQK